MPCAPEVHASTRAKPTRHRRTRVKPKAEARARRDRHARVRQRGSGGRDPIRHRDPRLRWDLVRYDIPVRAYADRLAAFAHSSRLMIGMRITPSCGRNRKGGSVPGRPPSPCLLSDHARVDHGRKARPALMRGPLQQFSLAVARPRRQLAGAAGSGAAAPATTRPS